MSVPPPTGTPSVDQVARFIRSRTQDSQGNEVGTFDSDTRPTDLQVQDHIAAAQALVELHLPALSMIPAGLLDAMAVVVALEAACQIEKSYWPEQVSSGRSSYAELRAEADAALQALVTQAAAAGTEFSTTFASVPVGSWTMTGAWP